MFTLGALSAHLPHLTRPAPATVSPQVRELPFCLALRLWDTYLAEGTGFSEFLVRGGAGWAGRVGGVGGRAWGKRRTGPGGR